MAASEDQNRLNRDQSRDSELEQYGVWVKAGPEDVDESEAEDEAFALTDLGDEEFDDAELDLLGADEEQSREPEQIDLSQNDEVDFEEIDLEAGTLEQDVDEPSAAGEEEEESLEDLLTLEEDDLTLDLDEETEEIGVDTADEIEEAEPLDAEPLDLDEGQGTEEPGQPEPVAEPEPFAEPELEVATAGMPGEAGSIDIDDELPGDLDDLTLDLDSLDVDAFEEKAQSEAGPAPEEPTIGSDEDELDLDSLELEDDTEVTELDLSSLPGEDDEFTSLSTDDLAQPQDDDLPELEVDDDLSLDEGFDDLRAVEDEMSVPAEEPAPAQQEREGDEGSRSLLESIERELSSIRTELGDLKAELAELRSLPGRAAEGTGGELTGEEIPAGGFFEDEGDEDETIALTGSELDNIMNTAEFTEETGLPTDYEEGVAGTGRQESERSQPVQDITLEETPEDVDTLDLDLSATEDLGPEEPAEPEAPSYDVGGFDTSDDEVETLASMDIDAELADIEELEDQTPEPPRRVDEDEPESLPDRNAEEEEPIFDAEPVEEPETTPESLAAEAAPAVESEEPIPENLKGELRSVLNYMDKLLDSLPEEKIQEFAASDHFKVYKRLFEELGLEQ